MKRVELAWVDDEPALLVSYCLTHPLRGWGVVDEGKTEKADNVPGSKVPDRLLTVWRTWLYATRTTNCCGYLEGALLFGLPVYFP